MPNNPSDPAYQLNELFQTIQRAHACHEIWWVYKNNIDRPKYIDVLNAYKFFFRISLHANFVAMLMNISKLFEKHRKTINIKNLLRTLEGSGRFHDSQLNHLRADLDKLQRLAEKIIILRNKEFAHITKNQQYDEVLDEAEIPYGAFRDLLERTLQLLNRIARLINVRECNFLYNFRQDILRILEDLKCVLSESNDSF
jgi:hypothetical protein